MTDAEMLDALIISYKKQLLSYKDMAAIVQKTLSQVVLSRGDIASVMANMTEKQKHLDRIVKERDSINTFVKDWQKRKQAIGINQKTIELDDLLSQIQTAIRTFLESEEQLKKYLEHVVRKGSSVL
jgi:hypothetical protein